MPYVVSESQLAYIRHMAWCR